MLIIFIHYSQFVYLYSPSHVTLLMLPVQQRLVCCLVTIGEVLRLFVMHVNPKRGNCFFNLLHSTGRSESRGSESELAAPQQGNYLLSFMKAWTWAFELKVILSENLFYLNGHILYNSTPEGFCLLRETFWYIMSTYGRKWILWLQEHTNPKQSIL